MSIYKKGILPTGNGYGTMNARFLKMAAQSQTSEELVRDWLSAQYREEFVVVSTEEQIAGMEHGWHVPDLRHKKKNLWIEVKEDLRASKTGNLAFEAACISRMKTWADYHKARVLIAYVNHRDFYIDIFAANYETDLLTKELEYTCAYRIDSHVKMGGDQLHKLWVIPIPVARKMVSCITNQVILASSRRMFSEIAKEKLIK
jgi:hypothetical protein